MTREGYEQQLADTRARSHRCPADGCTRLVPNEQLACRIHWARVSRPTQRRVYAAYRSGDNGAHLAALHDAIAEINARPAHTGGQQ